MSKSLTDFLTIAGGFLWTVVYVLIIVRSFRDKTYGMPFWALSFNFSWELIFSFVLVENIPEHLELQLFINRVWLAFDIAVLAAYFLYGKKEWPAHLPRGLFYPYSLLVLAIGYGFVYLMSVELEQSEGMYAAFIQNLMMSWLFIAMLNRRKSTKGQSVGIAAFKLLGSLAFTIVYGAQYSFVLFLGIGGFIADLIYLVMLIGIRRKWLLL